MQLTSLATSDRSVTFNPTDRLSPSSMCVKDFELAEKLRDNLRELVWLELALIAPLALLPLRLNFKKNRGCLFNPLADATTWSKYKLSSIKTTHSMNKIIRTVRSPFFSSLRSLHCIPFEFCVKPIH